jgi:phosphate transport system regulatory protein PhoU
MLTAAESTTGVTEKGSGNEAAAPPPAPAGRLSTRRRFDAGLDAVRDDLIRMGETAARMVTDAVTALTTADLDLARAVIERDGSVNALDAEVEERVLTLLATQQPLAIDLRFLAMALKIVSDLERICDHAVNIARTALRLTAAGVAYAPLIDLPRLSEAAVRLVRASVTAFAHRDAEAARAALSLDDELDVLYKEAQRDLRALLPEDPQRVVLVSHLLFVTHYLERIGDHAANLAERLEFIETGTPLPTRGDA